VIDNRLGIEKTVQIFVKRKKV